MTCADFSEDLVELYALGRLEDPDLTNFETHLLLWPECQDRVTEADRFLQTMREALWRTEPER